MEKSPKFDKKKKKINRDYYKQEMLESLLFTFIINGEKWLSWGSISF